MAEEIYVKIFIVSEIHLEYATNFRSNPIHNNKLLNRKKV